MALFGYEAQLLQGILVTLEVAVASAVFGVLLGILGAAAKLSRHAWISRPVGAVTDLLRGIPEFLILLICYFGLTNLLTGWFGTRVDISPFAGGVFALSIVFGAYASEAFRGAFLGVSAGQLEAAHAFGMRPLQVFFRIHLPQAWRLALPSLNNQWQNVIKDSSLVSIVGLEDLMRKAQIGAQVTKHPFNFYIAAALVYLLLLTLSNPLFNLLERRAGRGLRRR
ncbi:ABC transporter permease [Telmatospirillum siberiense]|uniref:Amino acid ABC transporter permease n=1 Tax=Telmatospirillum siberiense TaxID=382514 RepID=A0A2N3PVC9_9PROT|nr:ABC transporter permease subunit [Telmatospirillum siberiense]PKU24351.1 amino acid ABC transporter permease [Telmatospirillum siberiense]